MPELPDVEGFKQYLDSTALRQKIRTTHVRDKRILEEGVSASALGRALKGSSLRESRRHGKHVFVRIGSGGWLTMHFGMTGELVYNDGDDEEPKYARVVIELSKGKRLSYTCRRMLGEVGLTDDVDAYLQEHDIGPDALDSKLTLTKFRKSLEGRRGAIKGVVMDQSLLAGVGNVYADEVLFQARVHPQLKIDDLDDEEIGEVFKTMRRVLKLAAKHGGEVDQLPSSWLIPHREDGADCPKCTGKVKKTKVSGRSTYYCPRCQPK